MKKLTIAGNSLMNFHRGAAKLALMERVLRIASSPAPQEAQKPPLKDAPAGTSTPAGQLVPPAGASVPQ